MNVINFIKSYADQIDGQFTNYDHKTAVVIIPLGGGRFQTVLATLQQSRISGKEMVVFKSKVCEFSDGIDVQSLLQRSGNLDYSRFIIEEGFLKVAASALTEAISEDQVKETLQELAVVADEYEMTLTGQDIH